MLLGHLASGFFAAEKLRYIKYDRSDMSTNDVAGLL